MRLIKVRAPEGKGKDVMQVAFDVGIEQVSFHQEQMFSRNQGQKN